MERKRDLEALKRKLYTGVICDALDQMGYRNHALGSGISPLESTT